MVGTDGFAGRHAQRAEVAAVLRGRTPAPGLVVSGEAGCGKSRLLSVAADDARRDGVTILSGWCLRLSESLPLLPVLDILRALDAADDGQLLKDALADSPPFVGAEIDHLLYPAAAAPGDHHELGGSSARYRLFEAVAQVLTAAGRSTSVAVIVEDLHWADAMTLDLLEFLLSPARMGIPPIVVSFRTGESGQNLAREWCQRLVRADRVQHCPLPLMTPAETADQIGFLLGATPSAGLVESVFARTDGNAFFTSQLLAHDRATGAAPSAHTLAVPQDLAELMAARAGELTDAELEIVHALAVAARPLTDQELATAGGTSAETAQGALSTLTEHVLITPAEDGGHQLAHAVIGEALYATLLPGRRRHLHRGVAGVLAARPAGTLDGEVAGHLRAAGDAAAELAARIRAGRHADTVAAAVESAHHWSRAVELARASPPPTLPADISLPAMYGHAMDAVWVVGNTEEGCALAEEAYRDLYSDSLPVCERAGLLFRLGDARGVMATRVGLELMLRALELFESIDPSPGLVRTLRALEGQSNQAGDFPAARRYAARGLQLATELGMRQQRIHFLGKTAWIAMSLGDDDEAIRLMHLQQAEFSAGDAPQMRVEAAALQTDILLKLGHLADVWDAAAAGLETAVSGGLDGSFTGAILRCNAVEAATEQGRTDLAAELLDPVTPTIQVALNDHPDQASRAYLDMLRGQLTEAQERWHNLYRLDVGSLDFRLGYATMYVELPLWAGDPDAALTHAIGLLSEATGTDESSMCGPLLTLAVRACADLNDNVRTQPADRAVSPRAKEALDTLQELHARMPKDPLGAGSLTRTGHGDHATWQAEIARFHQEDSAAAWATAADAWQNLGRPHRAAYALWRQGETLLNQRDRTAAEPVLRAAAAAAVGHTPLLIEITALARRARIDLPTPVAATSTTGHEHFADRAPDRYQLTERELAVLQLIATGRTNIEIGRELFMSPKTASVHVSTILRKLQATSRTHAATIAHRAGLISDSQ